MIVVLMSVAFFLPNVALGINISFIYSWSSPVKFLTKKPLHVDMTRSLYWQVSVKALNVDKSDRFPQKQNVCSDKCQQGKV